MIVIYKKPATYGHSQYVFTVPSEIKELLDKDKLYKITIEEVKESDVKGE